MEKTEALLISHVNSTLEDAIVFLVTSKTNKPLEGLAK
jgi:hypothetical protein